MTKRKPPAVVADQEYRLDTKPRTATEKWTDRWAPLGTFPSTPGRISSSILLAVATGLKAIWIWQPPPWGLVVFICLLAGIDATQYLGKRATDADYQAAKANK